jgi:hypothetical protein
VLIVNKPTYKGLIVPGGKVRACEGGTSYWGHIAAGPQRAIGRVLRQEASPQGTASSVCEGALRQRGAS